MMGKIISRRLGCLGHGWQLSCGAAASLPVSVVLPVAAYHTINSG